MIKHLILTTFLLFGTSAFAEMQTMTFMQQNSIDGIEMFQIRENVQQALRSQGEDPSSYQLEGVTLYARSMIGDGKASLIVGHDRETKIVKRTKNVGNFLLDLPKSYRLLEWDLRDQPGQMEERWNMRFRGIMDIRFMDVHISSRGRRIRIPMGGQLYRGYNTLRIKKELRQLGYNPQRMKLRKITLVAKSKRGRGTAQLYIGPNTKPMKTVGLPQAGLDFLSDRPRSYNRIEWRAQGPTKGPWQIDLQGRIKVKAIIVHVR